MKKRFLSALLVLCMVVTMLPSQVLAADVEESDFVIEDGVLTKYTGAGGDVVIPDGVTSIEKAVFYRCTGLTSVTIPNSVTNIGERAFYACSSLTSVTIPDSVTSIGVAAFSGCSSLTSVAIPYGVSTIEENTFDLCESLTYVTIPDSVTTIKAWSFANIGNSLTDVYYGGSESQWLQIEVDAAHNSALVNAAIHFNGVFDSPAEPATRISGPCGKEVTYSYCNGVLTIQGIGPMAYYEAGYEPWASYSHEKIHTIIIGNGVTNIGEFSSCHNLTSVTIPNSVSTVRSYAFSYCSSLTSVNIPGGVTSIEDFAFYACDSLTDVHYSGSENQWKQIAISRGNDPLLNATIHYNSTGSEPTPTPDPDPIIPGPSGLTLISSVPADGAENVDKHSEFVLTFSGEISKNLNWPKGTIRFVNYETGELALEINGQNFYQQGGRVFGATLILDYVLAHEKLVPGTYSVLIDAGVILASELNSDGTLSSFSGINDKDELVFTIPPAIVEVPSKPFNVAFDKASASVDWNDGWFQYPATTYIHKLAVASIALSAAAYSERKIYDALDDLDFEDISSKDYEWSFSSNGSAGYTFAHKPISIGSKQFTLVAVVVRGSKNTADWLSNFLDSGWVDGDSGFEDAAKGIMQALKTYCAEKSIDTGHAKFLVTGHSRGGLIANIIAADLTTQEVLDGVHFSHLIDQSGVYGYTFASPRPVTGAVKLDCPNIWNIINYPDIVPELPINFSPRYGNDLFLPHRIYYPRPFKYDQFREPMRTEYYRLTGDDYHETMIGSFTLDGISGILPHIGEVHSKEAYYCWLSKYTASELFGPWKYKETTTSCPVDVFVYDEAGTLVASIVNDEVVVDELEAAVVVENSETQEKKKIVYLPTDQTYSVEIRATGEGTVSYTVREMEVTGEESLNMTLGTSDRILRTVSFDDIEIVADDVLTGKVDDPFSIPADDYALTKNGTEVIHATSDSAGALAPTDLTWGQFLYQGELMELPGAISCKVNSGDDRVFIQVYRKNPSGSDELIYGMSVPAQKVGDEYMVISDALARLDPYLFERNYCKELETGTYYFTARLEENGTLSTNVATSGEWYYTKSNDRLTIPETVQSSLVLNGRTAVWSEFPQEDQEQALNCEAALLYSKKRISDPALDELTPITSFVCGIDSTRCGFPDRSFSKSGYYYVSLRVISKDITQQSTSYWSAPSPATYYSVSVSPGTPSMPSVPSYDYISTGQSYNITVQFPIFNGTVETNRTSATRGSKVTITVTPDDNCKLETLVVKDANGNIVSTDAADDNHYEFIMPGSNVTVNATFIYSKQFIDVAKDAFYYDAVLWATKNGITNGTSIDTFSPANPCTRGEIVTFLWRANGSPKVSGSNIFVDVDPNAFYYDAVLWAVANGITNGTGIDTFSPYATCTRGEAVTFLHRSKGTPTASGNAFIDVSNDAFYANAVSWAVSNGITNGTGAGTFSPSNICTRGEIVTFLYRDMA